MTPEAPSEDAPENTASGTPDERLAAAVQAQQLAAVLDLSREERDVTALDSLSWSRILSTLRGSRTSDLDREKAEAQAARYAAGVALARSTSDRNEARALAGPTRRPVRAAVGGDRRRARHPRRRGQGEPGGPRRRGCRSPT